MIDPAEFRSRVRRRVIGVMGAGEGALESDLRMADRLGELLSREGWIVLTGGRPAGIMESALRGAKRVEGSLTLGILPTPSGPASDFADIVLYTGLGSGRNVINVLSSDVVVALGTGGAGTASEICLALKANKPVVLVAATPEALAYFGTLGGTLHGASSAEEALETIRLLLE